MNHEDDTDPWFSQRPETPLWDAAEYNQLISAGPLLPVLEQYANVGSYDPTTPAGIPWQVQAHGANADRCMGDQLQVANVANQGPSCSAWQQVATMYLPSTSNTGCYGGTTPTNISWQAS
ncbi:uncharacterized protein [Triticum aestivum]|uniref:uncharacterized protein n=1 Tax=Triticum aestivum TaxID=4565 RepID=UPI001D00646E|nr:uncharacterized protein LOC123157193 [Triticum aestivum]